MRGHLLARSPDKLAGQATVNILIDGQHGLGLRAIALDHHLERCETSEGSIHRRDADAFRQRLLPRLGEEL